MPQIAVTPLLVSGFPGVIADDSFLKDVGSYVNAETVNQLPFGIVCMQGINDNDCLLVTAGNVAKLCGVVVYSAAYNKPGELGISADAGGRIGLVPGTPTGLMKRGRIWVKVEEAVTPASPVRIRCTVAGLGAGTFRTTSAGGGLSMNLSAAARYLDTAPINGVARVEIDFTMRAAFTAD